MTLKELKQMSNLELYKFLVEEKDNVLQDIFELHDKRVIKYKLWGIIPRTKFVFKGVSENPKSLYLKINEGKWKTVNWDLDEFEGYVDIETYFWDLEDKLGSINKEFLLKDTFARELLVDTFVEYGLIDGMIENEYTDDIFVQEVLENVQ